MKSPRFIDYSKGSLIRAKDVGELGKSLKMGIWGPLGAVRGEFGIVKGFCHPLSFISDF